LEWKAGPFKLEFSATLERSAVGPYWTEPWLAVFQYAHDEVHGVYLDQWEADELDYLEQQCKRNCVINMNVAWTQGIRISSSRRAMSKTECIETS
jgi:hypothetical protein